MPRSRSNAATRNAKPASTGRGFYRGTAGRDKVESEAEKAKQRKSTDNYNAPFRFWMPAGSEAEVMILDDAPDFFMYEHEVYNPNAANFRDKRKYYGCTKEFDNCPVCEKDKESYYGLYLTVIDFTPYEGKNGTVEWTRKLFVVKGSQQKKFLRKYDKEGSLRGLVLRLNRDGPKDPVIGNDIEFENYEEESFIAEHVREWTDKEGKTHTEDCSKAYVYEQLFEEPNTEHLRQLIGAAPAAGSDAEYDTQIQDADTDWSSDSEQDSEWADTEDPAASAEEEVPWEDEEETPTKRSPRRRSQQAAAPEAEEPPSSRRSSRAAPTGRRSRRA